MPFILRPCGTCPASGHRIANSVKAIVSETPKLPMTEQGKDHCPTSRHLSCFPTKPHCVVRTAQVVHKNAYRFCKMQPFFVLSIFCRQLFAEIHPPLSLPSAVRRSPPVFERRAVIFHNGYIRFL